LLGRRRVLRRQSAHDMRDPGGVQRQGDNPAGCSGAGSAAAEACEARRQHHAAGMRRLAVALLGVALAGGLIPVQALGRSGFTWEELQLIDKSWPNATATSTGLRRLVLREGQGEHPKPGEVVRVLYKGMFLDGRVFDARLEPGEAFSFRLGRGEIIEGWEEGILLMRRGEKCVLLVPFELAYGSRGQAGRIPRQTSLAFEVELLDIKPFTPAPAAPPTAPLAEGNKETP
jgi:hypothetical protein